MLQPPELGVKQSTSDRPQPGMCRQYLAPGNGLTESTGPTRILANHRRAPTLSNNIAIRDLGYAKREHQCQI